MPGNGVLSNDSCAQIANPNLGHLVLHAIALIASVYFIWRHVKYVAFGDQNISENREANNNGNDSLS